MNNKRLMSKIPSAAAGAALILGAAGAAKEGCGIPIGG